MEAVSSLDTIYYHITKACNLRCVYCYFSAGVPQDKELSTAEALSVFLSAIKINPRRIVITGGEPLLRNDILKFGKTLKNEGNGIWSCISTNGTLINEQNARDLVQYFDEIRISIDGPQEINDAMRGKGTFEKAMQGFRSILSAGGNPLAFITVTSPNISYLKEFINFLLWNGITRIHFTTLKIVGRAKDEKMLCNIEEVKRIVEGFSHKILGIGFKKDIKKTRNCGVGKFLTITPDGSIYPCHVLTFPEFCLGNVRKQNLNVIYHNSSLLKKLRNLNFNEIAQRTCELKKLSEKRRCLGALAQEVNFRNQFKDLLHINV